MKRRPRRGLMLVLLVAATVGCAAGNAKETPSGAESDVRLFASELERIHPNPYHATSREEYARRVDELAGRADSLDRDHLVVELMRSLALLASATGTRASTRCTLTRSRCTSTPFAPTGSPMDSRWSTATSRARSSSRSRAFRSTRS